MWIATGPRTEKDWFLFIVAGVPGHCNDESRIGIFHVRQRAGLIT